MSSGTDVTAEGEIAAPHAPQSRRLWGRPSTLSRIREACAQEGTAIFFAEDRSDWLHIGPLAELVAEMGKPVLRLTGDPNDPMYRNLFDGWARDGFFPLYYTRDKVEGALVERIDLNPSSR